MSAKWLPSQYGYQMHGDGFLISYADSFPCAAFAGDEECEIALVGPDGFLILNGDFRSAYERLIPEGYEACKRFYEQQSAHAQSTWSDA